MSGREVRVHPLAPVIGLDVDGTLAKYYDHFHTFAENYLQEPLDLVWNDEFRGEFSEALGLDKATYRQIKLAYRQGGLKRSIPTMGNLGFVQDLRARGVQVWICTTRPWNRLDNIDPDTQFWLNRNVGRVDGVIYGEEKYEDLLDIVGLDRILGVVDDLPENIERARELQIPALLRYGRHNAWWEGAEQDISAVNTQDIKNWCFSQFGNYKAKEVAHV